MKKLLLHIKRCEECPYSNIHRPTFGHCMKVEGYPRIRFVVYNGEEERNFDIPDWCPLEEE
jgi:hypothetical protein